ncbi:MAG: modification methylase HemK [Symbiobacteriaceae bacterium]|jgi:methylase of polypeptide subunit release factors|nr:modification methylase HemK [Symbiobacteriaceae bacterium]
MALPQTAGVRIFENRDLDASDRIARHIGRGGLAVLDAPWAQIVRLRKTLAAKGAGRDALRGLMVKADAVTPQPMPGLQALQQGGLVALDDVLFALDAVNNPQPVEALGGSVITIHPDVLVPRSQPLIHLLRRALEQVGPVVPQAPAILDMGCGSGVCSLLAAQVFPTATVAAADHLPEAVASTAVNAARFEAEGRIRPGAVVTAEPGDLYDTLGERRYDLIIFNAPWVAAPARNRMETALNDGGQQTIRRFLAGAPARLNPGGRVIVGYADHSGPKAIENLERFICDAGLRIESRQADRIKTHRSRRAWESIYAYELSRVQ